MKKTILFGLIFAVLTLALIGILLVTKVIASVEARDTAVQAMAVIGIITVTFTVVWQAFQLMADHNK
jgi:hypothetical protein